MPGTREFRPRRPPLLAAALVAALALALGCRQGENPELAPHSIGGDFTLTGSDGKPFRLASLHGKTVLLFFGFTACPEACPTTMARLARAVRLLEEKELGGKVATVFVSLDPERDTPEKLREYVGYFALHPIGVTGTPEQVAAVAKLYGASYEKTPVASAAGYLIDHSTYVYLIDPVGRVRHLFRQEDSPDRIAELVAELVRSDFCDSTGGTAKGGAE